MTFPLVPFLTFVLVTTFTPGPNNLSSAALAMRQGYRRTIPYMAGIAFGFMLVQLLCVALTSLLSSFLSAAGLWIRIAGALYILYLAFHLLRVRYEAENGPEALQGERPKQDGPAGLFIRGTLLQIVNAKGIVYGLTVYSLFLADLGAGGVPVLIFPPLLATLSFISVFCWALFGSAIGSRLKNDKVRFAVNGLFFLLLVYVAADMLFGYGGV